jgi:2,4-dienoyl-CoA reductase-like NADH-dependent reductase (Old Yellow Enzyme family)
MLLAPLQIREIELRNRIAVSPMCQYSSDDGFASDWHLVHLGSRAVGGAGLVIAEATAVEARGRITPGDLGIWKDAHIEMLGRIARFIKAQGAVPGIQLAHAGRKASCNVPWRGGAAIPPDAPNGWQTVAPSAVPFQAADPAPQALSVEEIGVVLKAFEAAAQRALSAGFEVVEIHAAHGYLLHEFLSPLSNKRTDQYGGSLENRMRFVLEATAAVRRVWPLRLPLFLRISASDWAEGGWTVEDSVQLARKVKELGVDLVDCSSGAIVPGVKIPLEPGYQVPFSERIRREAGVMTGAVGVITEPEQAEDILAGGRADLVLLAREFLRDPYFPLRASKKLGVVIDVPAQYGRAW